MYFIRMQDYSSDIAFDDFALTLICDMSRHVVIVTCHAYL